MLGAGAFGKVKIGLGQFWFAGGILNVQRSTFNVERPTVDGGILIEF